MVMETTVGGGDNAPTRFVGLFAQFEPTHPVIRENWIHHILPTMVQMIYGRRDRFRVASLDALKALCDTYLDRSEPTTARR